MTGDRVYVIDDDEAVRDSLLVLVEIAGYAVRGFESALDFLEAAAQLPPGCVITDVRMPQMDGLELLQAIGEKKLRFAVIVMTGHGDVPMAVSAMKAGAVDFVEKPFDEAAIRAVVRTAFGHLVQRESVSEASERARSRLGSLTAREREVLDGLVAGLPNKTIAYDLDISPRTVEIHRARVMGKTGVRSLSELVRLALSAGLEPGSR